MKRIIFCALLILAPILSMAAAPSPAIQCGRQRHCLGGQRQPGRHVGGLVVQPHRGLCRRLHALDVPGPVGRASSDRALAAKPQHRRFGLWRRPLQ